MMHRVRDESESRRSGFGFFVVVVIFVGGHWFFAALFPEAIVGGNFPEGASHFANVRCDCTATGADVIDAERPGFRGVVGHFATRELIGIELVGKRGQAGEIAMVVRGAVGDRLASDETFYGAAHFGGERERVLRAAKAIEADDIRACVYEGASAVGGGLAVGRDIFIFEMTS